MRRALDLLYTIAAKTFGLCPIDRWASGDALQFSLMR